MEAAAVIRQLQVHVIVKLLECQSANFSEVDGDHVLSEVRKKGVNRYEIDTNRLPAGDKVHFAEPSVNKLSELDVLIPVHDGENLIDEPVFVGNYYSIDEGYQIGEEARAGWHGPLHAVLCKIGRCKQYELLLSVKDEPHSILADKRDVLQLDALLVDGLPEYDVRYM